ncbi:MAG: acyltransferase [Actinomycetes bacterium]
MKICVRMMEYARPIAFSLVASVVVPIQARAFLLRLLGADVGRGARVARGVVIGSRKLRIHDDVFINIGCFLDGSDWITIEEGVQFGPYVNVLTGSHHYARSVYRRGIHSTDSVAPVWIRRGAWVGMGASLLPGVVIAEGCVIAAGAVVAQSTEPNGLYAGIPARRIKDLTVELDDEM